jgi:rod shape-determining protein MreD
MIAPLLLFSLVGVVLFYFQNLLLFPQVRLRLIALLLFYVGLRPSFAVAIFLALILGLVQDSFTTTPFGLHLEGALLMVGMARFCRRRLLLKKIMPQIAVTVGALTLQEAAFLLTLILLGVQPLQLAGLPAARGPEILATTALAPLMYALLQGLENHCGRYLARSLRVREQD